MPQHYGRPLSVTVTDGRLVIEIGIHTLAHAVSYADWANPYDHDKLEYLRTFAISDAQQFADDVKRAMLSEREDGSTPLSDFLDKMSEAAINDGSMGLLDAEVSIKHGTNHPCETWSTRPPQDQE